MSGEIIHVDPTKHEYLAFLNFPQDGVNIETTLVEKVVFMIGLLDCVV